MRKFILYSLLVLLLLATVTLAFGFYNAKRVRDFARQATVIRAENSFGGELQEIEKYFSSSESEESQSFQEQTKDYPARLDALIEKTEKSRREINSIWVSRPAREVREDILNYYAKAGQQAKDMKVLVGFMNNVLDISAVFGNISENITLEQIKSLIDEAKAKSESVSTEELPEGMRESGTNLVSEMRNFLTKIEDVVSQKNEDPKQLEESYSAFSRAEEDFFLSAETRISQMEDLTPLKNKIDMELNALGKIYFDLK